MLLTLIAVIIVLSPIVLIHELGHFIACKLSGIGVNEFAFGFGKKLWSKKYAGTEFSLRAIPFGGFVSTKGDMFLPSGAPAPKSDEFAAKKWWVKFIMVISGAVMNYVLAFIIFTGVTFFMGTPVNDIDKLPPVVGEAVANMPAQKYGILPGDKIVNINGLTITNWKGLTDALAATEGDVKVEYLRGEKGYDIFIPEAEFNAARKLGVVVQPVFEEVRFGGAVISGASQCWHWTYFSLHTIYKNIFKDKKAPDIAGPVGIVHIVHKAVRTSVADFVFLIGLLSLAVGMFNLFPIPVLDGGYALMFLIEGIRGNKQIPLKAVEMAVNIGFGLLILLVLYATFFDVARLGWVEKIWQLFSAK